jgi:CrcB protein
VAVRAFLAVALGGAVGSALRWMVSGWFSRPGLELPWGTFTVNVTGALLMGFLARYFAPPHGSPAMFLALTVGLCGGYTTFSSFSLDMLTMVERGSTGRAILYALASVLFSYAALALGYLAARSLRPLP